MPKLLTPPLYDAYLALRREMLENDPWSFLSSPEDNATPDHASLAARLNDRNVIFIQTDPASRVIAAAGLYQNTRPKIAHIANIWGVYTTPPARAQGHARALMLAAIAHAKSWHGVTRLNLSASARSTTANRLYQSLGFTRWGTQPDAIHINNESADEHHYTLDLATPQDTGIEPPHPNKPPP